MPHRDAVRASRESVRNSAVAALDPVSRRDSREELPPRVAGVVAGVESRIVAIPRTWRIRRALNFWHTGCNLIEPWRRSGSAPIDGNGRAHRSESESRGLRGSTPNKALSPKKNRHPAFPESPGHRNNETPRPSWSGGFFLSGRAMRRARRKPSDLGAVVGFVGRRRGGRRRSPGRRRRRTSASARGPRRDRRASSGSRQAIASSPVFGHSTPGSRPSSFART